MRGARLNFEKRAGYALFFVLSLILLMSLLLAGVTRDSRQQAKAALRALEAAEARAEAGTALSLTLMRLLAAKPEDRWPADGNARLLKVGETEWRVTVTPEDGKVDINHAPPLLLAELFAAAGVSPDEAQALADRVADWRDADDLTHINGAERRAYETAGLPPPRNGPFLKPQELKFVMGLTDDLYACIADAITVYSGKAGIDRRFAPELLRGRASESNEAVAAGTPAKSPVAFESSAGKAVGVRLERRDDGHRNYNSIFVIRLTESPLLPWWFLSSQLVSHDPVEASPGCLLIVPHPHP